MIHDDLMEIMQAVKAGKEGRMSTDDGGLVTVKKTWNGKYKVKITDNRDRYEEFTMDYKNLTELFKKFSKKREELR